jgi:hypothetical protein
MDLEGDGDLTQPSNKIAGTRSEAPIDAESKEPSFSFHIAKLEVGGAIHNDFNLGAAGPRFFYRLMWAGKTPWMGPYAVDRDSAVTLGESLEKAPILVPGGVGPFQFELWYSDALTRGEEETIKVFLGNVGSARGAFSSSTNEFLPKGEYVVVELLYTDKDNQQKSFLAELRERC